MSDQLDLKYIAGLVTKAQAGDSNAFAELYAATFEAQYAFAFAFLKDGTAARETLQDIYIYAMKNLTKLRDPHLVMAWLNQRNMTVCFRLLERRQRDKALEEGREMPVTDPESRRFRIDGEEYTIRTVSQLPFTQSQVILLKYLCGLDVRSMADILVLSRSEVKRYLADGLKELREHYTFQGGVSR